jgi:hypothetical protein
LLDQSPNLTLHSYALVDLGGLIVEFADEPLVATFDEVLHRHDTQPDPTLTFDRKCVQRAFADYDLARGRVDDAEPRYREALAWAERERCPIEAGRCHQGLADIAEQHGDHTTALEHLEVAGALFAQRFSTWAR